MRTAVKVILCLLFAAAMTIATFWVVDYLFYWFFYDITPTL